MLDIGDAFEIKRPATQNNLVFIGYYTKTSQKPQPEKYNRYTHKKKMLIALQLLKELNL